MAQMHAIQNYLNTTLNNLDQVLEDQGRQINRVASLNIVHKPVVNLVYCGMHRLYGPKKMRYEQMQKPVIQLEVQSIVVGNEHAHREPLMLITTATIRHVKNCSHISLGNPDRYTHNKCINSHNAERGLIGLDCLL